MTGPLRNQEGQLSGAKMVLWLASLLAIAWLMRDLATGRDLTEWHTTLLSILLVVGLVNRMSARGRFRLRIKDVEMEGGEEPNGHPHER